MKTQLPKQPLEQGIVDLAGGLATSFIKDLVKRRRAESISQRLGFGFGFGTLAGDHSSSFVWDYAF